MKLICHTCMNWQEKLDPEGCFQEYSTTGFFGKLLRTLLGCEGYYTCEMLMQ